MNTPGDVILISPPQVQVSMEFFVSAGRLPIRVRGAPGSQGEKVMGMQGIGVNTPNAEAVAESTVGLRSEEHMPNGRIFSKGLWSMIFAAGNTPQRTRLLGNTLKIDGAQPKEHFKTAVAQTF